MADYASMSDEELAAATKDQQEKDNLPTTEAEKLQVEICKRANQKFTLPDGSVAYEPPDWKGD